MVRSGLKRVSTDAPDQFAFTGSADGETNFFANATGLLDALLKPPIGVFFEIGKWDIECRVIHISRSKMFEQRRFVPECDTGKIDVIANFQLEVSRHWVRLKRPPK